MLHDIPWPMAERMRLLEAMDIQDRRDGTSYVRRLRQIPSDTGRLLAILAASSPEGAWLEVGASAGYSALWLALACRATGRRLITFEIDRRKLELARETFRVTGVEDVVTLVEGDAIELLPSYSSIAFCFVDHDKDTYREVYDLVVPRLVPGGLLVADNVTSHVEPLQTFMDAALRDDRMDAVLVPIDRGVLLCRKT